MALILIMLAGAAISCAVAAGKNRNALGWFFIGFLFPLLGVILAIVLPPAQRLEIPRDIQL